MANVEKESSLEKESVKAVSEILKAACLPAAEEFGYLLKEKVTHWRTRNQLNTLEKMKTLLAETPDDIIRSANPRVMSSILESCADHSDSEVQNMWAGLMASSFTGDDSDDENILYVNILNQLTTYQCKLLDLLINDNEIFVTKHGLPVSRSKTYFIEDFLKLAKNSDLQKVDVSLDHLREVGLINGGIDIRESVVVIEIKSLFIYLYVRCKGWKESPLDYFEVNAIDNILPPTDFETSIQSFNEVIDEAE